MDLSLLIHTFNQYEFLWDECLEAWSQVDKQNCEYYWGTDTEAYGKHDFGTFHVKNSGVGSWSDRLTRLLHQIPTDYIMYCQEDHWPIKSPPKLNHLMQIVEENDLLRLQISPINRFYTLYGAGIPLFFDQKSKYLVSHQPSIWKKSFLLECISYNEDPWLNEYEGTKRLNNDPKIIERIGILPYGWFHHACERGKKIPIPNS